MLPDKKYQTRVYCSINVQAQNLLLLVALDDKLSSDEIFIGLKIFWGSDANFCTAIKRDLQNIRGVTNASMFSSQYFQLYSPFPAKDYVQEMQAHTIYSSA